MKQLNKNMFIIRQKSPIYIPKLEMDNLIFEILSFTSFLDPGLNLAAETLMCISVQIIICVLKHVC